MEYAKPDNRRTPRIPFVLGLAAAIAFGLPADAKQDERQLVAILAPAHDPLYLDAASLRRTGTRVSFKYVLDVPAPPEEGHKPSAWRSNEIEAVIDCATRTVEVRKLIAHPGPRASGAATAVHTFDAPGRKPEPITPNSTFAYLEAHVCRGR
jgi:hypothetical protein